MFFIKNKAILSTIVITTFFTYGAMANNKSKVGAPEVHISDITHKNNDKVDINIDWSVNMTDSNLIWKTSFEDNDYIPSHSNESANLISDEESYLGIKSLRIQDSKLKGNFKYENESSKTSRVVFNNIYNLQPGMKFSANFKVKNLGEKASISLIPESSTFSKRSKPFHIKYNLSEPIIVDEDCNGSNFIKIRNFEYLQECMKDNSSKWISNKIVTDYDGTGYSIKNSNLDIENRSIKVNNGTFDYKAGDELHFIFLEYPLSLGTVNINSSNDWEEYSLNGTMKDLDNYDVATKGLKLIMETKNLGSLYIDDFKLGYASKVKLFRDNKQIYEGYDSQFKDTVIDSKSPDKIENIKYNIKNKDNRRFLEVEFDVPKDNGNTYIYNAVSVDKEGIESEYSDDISVEAKSGIKGYSYEINNSIFSIPDDIIDTELNSFEYELDNSKKSLYLHIKAIDNTGNVGAVTHLKIDSPILKVNPNHREDYINLNWDFDRSQPYIYKVYKKTSSEDSFQSISNINIDKSSKINVLNLYPYNNNPNSYGYQQTLETESYETWDGEEITLPTSASLKKWMEMPNDEHPKGYGQGIIEVTPITILDFNNNPKQYLYDENGEYIYDSIMIGSWDSNATNTINNDAGNELLKFVESGRGLLLGHDTITHSYGLGNSFYKTFSNKLGILNNGSPNVGRNKVYINKKSVFTKYPWNIGDIGDELNIPNSHTQGNQSEENNTFLKFKFDKFGTTSGVSGDYVVEDEIYTNRWFLTIKNNIGAIQTGHSNGRASVDEQKIIANALFYLNQLSQDTYLNDYSGQDVNPPNRPSINGFNISSDNKIRFSLDNIEDNGTTYDYYIEAISQDDNTIKESNIATTEIKSGVKGYSYVLDYKEDTIPDNIIDSLYQDGDIEIDFTPGILEPLYLHINAIDNAGNISDTLHYKIEDKENPKLTIDISNNNITKNDLNILVTASDNICIDYIKLPNGQKVYNSKTSYIISSNGDYTFSAYDKFGNYIEKTINIDNIDKDKPIVVIDKNNIDWTNKPVKINISSRD